MKSRIFKRTLGVASVLVTSMWVSLAQAQQPECETLFVQTAKAVEMTETTITLKGVSPLISFFCDRPVRHAGHLSNEEYLKAWDAGKDSFAADPPNAMLSILDGNDAHDVVVELQEKPSIEGDDYTYKMTVLEGEPISTDQPGSMFIDIIGRPLTPLSYAGVDRRITRRVVRRCAVGVTCW
ncbi:hypothetical protein V1T76_26295 [Roseibium sp. FZY0029]|uniref:hypothetical protein n=1 Tax=Roseibium sp. FZY0029 TaxID=3116647 RepID=UPI002EC36DCE|nr:hypothetical protein [Roseibium sp. FZY0029]